MAESAPELDLRAIEQQLRSRLADTQDRISELTKPPEANAEIGFGKRIGDGTNEAISRFSDVGVANDLHATEKRIERAVGEARRGQLRNVRRVRRRDRRRAPPCGP